MVAVDTTEQEFSFGLRNATQRDPKAPRTNTVEIEKDARKKQFCRQDVPTDDDNVPFQRTMRFTFCDHHHM